MGVVVAGVGVDVWGQPAGPEGTIATVWRCRWQLALALKQSKLQAVNHLLSLSGWWLAVCSW